MSVEGIDPLTEVNKKLVINTSLLWTGISVTNRRLTDTVLGLKKVAESSLKLSRIMESEFRLLIRTVATNTKIMAYTTAKQGEFLGKLIDNFKETFTETFTTGIQVLTIGIRGLTLAIRDLGRGMGLITTVLDMRMELFRRTENVMFESMRKGEGTPSIEGISEEYISAMKSHANKFIAFQWALGKRLDLVRKSILGDEGEGKKKKPIFKKYEGANEFLQNIQKFVDKIAEVSPGVAKKATEFMGNFAKRQVVKAFQQGIGFLKQVINLGTSPAMESLTQTLGSIAKIINVILIPLKPFIFFLDIFAKVLEAALSPMQEALYEALIPIMEDLVEMLPELMDLVQDWIGEGLLDEVILGMINAFTGLLDSLIKGNLMKQIFDLSVNILTLATTLISSNLILSLFRLTGVIIDLAFTLLKPGPDGKTLIEQIIELAVVLGGFALTIFTAFRPLIDFIIGIDIATLGRVIYGMGLVFAFMAGVGQGGGFPWGLILGGIYAGIWAAVASPLLSLQEGGTVPGVGPVPIMAHGGEQVWSEAKQDDMIELLEEQIYLQKAILKIKEEKYR